MAKYIEKDAFLRQYGPCNPEVFEKPEHANGWNALLSAVEAFSSVDAEPVRHGRWILEKEPDGNPYCFHCSECDNDFHNIEIRTAFSFCPNCGAKMSLEKAK